MTPFPAQAVRAIPVTSHSYQTPDVVLVEVIDDATVELHCVFGLKLFQVTVDSVKPLQS